MALFSRAEDLTVQHTADKLSNGVALTVSDLGKEPAKGLLRVVDHVQTSVPVLLQAHGDVCAAHAQVKTVLEEARDVCAGVASVVGSVSTGARRQLRGSLEQLAEVPGRSSDD